MLHPKLLVHLTQIDETTAGNAEPNGDEGAHPQAQQQHNTLLTNAMIRQQQATDSYCQNLIKYVNHDGLRVSKHDLKFYHAATRCRLIDGILFYRDFVRWTDSYNLIIVVPRTLQQQIVKQFHSTPACHARVIQSFLRMRRLYYWPTMHKDIDNFCKQCLTCTRNLTRNNKHSHGTFSTTQHTFMNQALACDLIETGDSNSPYKYALVAILSFSRYAYVKPLRTRDSATVARALMEVFADKYTPHTLHSDNGPEFQGAVNEATEEQGIKHTTIVPHTSNSNGAVERMNEEIQRCIRRLRIEYPDKCWTDFLPAILKHLRNMITDSHHS